MKKRLMSTLLMGAFFLASTSMFVSCKDYDDDINANTKAIQNVETSLKEQIATLNSALQQEKTAAAAAHSQYEDAIAKAQAAADAANKSLSDALVAAATHATTSYVDDAVKNGTADKATVSQLNDAIGNLQTTLNAAIDGKASTADLNSAIAAVNDKIAALQGDIAAATNAQSTLSATLTAAINAVDQKVDTKASTEAVNALSTVLQNVQQSMQTKADVQEAIAAATANLATNASVAEKIQAAADKAASDVNLAKAELQAYADKAATAAAAEAAATAKAEAIASAIQSAQNLEEKLTTSINQLQKDGAAADAQLQKNLSDSVAVLVAKIGGINTNLSKLIDINANAIEKNLAAIENINLQIDALNRFTGLLEDKNVVSLKDSLRLTYAELQAAKKTLGDELIRIETKVDENALAYAAALLTQKNELTARIDSLRDNYATDEELEAAVVVTTALIGAVDDRIDDLIDGDITTLKNKVKAIEDNIGEASIAAMLKDIEDINKTITVSGLGKIENLDEILEDLQGQIDDLDGALSEYKDKNDARVKALEDAGFISETAIDGKIATAVSGINTELGKYVQKAEIDQFLTGTKVVAALQTAGFALSSDLDAYVKTETLDNYLKKADLTTEAIEALGFITKDGVNGVQAIANAARDEAKTAANEDLQAAINAYDAQLAAALKSLFAQITGAANEGANGDDEAVELPEEAKKAIEELKEAFEETGGLSPQIATEINTLWITLDGKLTSLVFYPEAYYGGIESIEITALKIENIFGLKDTEKKGTAEEAFEEIAQKNREYDIFPNGYAKYHINPVNADLTGYTLAFIDHTAVTRSAENPYLVPVEADASKNTRDANDILWVEFENSAEIFNAINKASSVPSMAHNSQVDGNSHYVYGLGEDYGKGIVTALTATKDSSYVASDYAMLVPVTINSLVIANSKPFGKNYDEGDYETSDLSTNAFSHDADEYGCLAANKFHLHRKVKERIADTKAINKLMYNEEFDLKTLVETHFVNNAMDGADQKVDDDFFRRLNLDYRFYPIDYTTDDITGKETTNNTSETKFMTLTEADPETGEYFNGKGYFNQVKENQETNGEKVLDADGKPVLANKASLGRQPVVRVELYRKDKPEEVLAIGYLKLEISSDVEKDAESFKITSNRDYLFAVCDVDRDWDEDEDGNLNIDFMEDEDMVVLTWDQIQTQLNGLIGGEGLSPKEWNTYEVEDGQYIFDSATGEIVSIDEVEYSLETPYYQLGTLIKGEDRSSQGNHTDVLAWAFDGCDYQALKFDLLRRSTATTMLIDETTGAVKEAVKRYFKLTSTDSANPDLYVGIEIPAGFIRFPAGQIGDVKGAYWKAPASNLDGDNDIALNVELKVKTSNTADEAAGETYGVPGGEFWRIIQNNFFGEQILVKLNYDGLNNDLKAEAKEKWEEDNAYHEWFTEAGKEAITYFRMPIDGNNSEGDVLSNGKWIVKGISMNGTAHTEYQLTVTDWAYTPIYEAVEGGSSNDGDDDDEPTSKLKTKYWHNYGKTVSVIGINGKSLVDPKDEANDDFYEALTAQLGYDPEADDFDDMVDLVQKAVVKVQAGKDGFVWGIRVMTIETDPDAEDEEGNSTFTKFELLTKATTSNDKGTTDATKLVEYELNAYADAAVDLSEDGATPNESNIVKGITQDMLNYAAHDFDANDQHQKLTRPYNKQLTAFMVLVADDNAIFTMPDGCGNFYKAKTQEGDKANYETCFILPGKGQKDMDCQYCPSEEIEGTPENTYSDCRPMVQNKLFAIRLYKPVHVESKGVAYVKDAALKLNSTDIPFGSVISFTDWAGYVPGGDFTNFIKYYGIEIEVPEGVAEANEVDANEPNEAPTVDATDFSFIDATEDEDGNVTGYTYWGGAVEENDAEELEIENLDELTAPDDYIAIYDAAKAIVENYAAPNPIPADPGTAPAEVAEKELADVATVTLPTAYTGNTSLYDNGTLDETVTPNKTTFKLIIAGDNKTGEEADNDKYFWSTFPNTQGNYDENAAIYLTTAPAALGDNPNEEETTAYNAAVSKYNYWKSDKAKATASIVVYKDGETLYNYDEYKAYLAYQTYKNEKAAYDAAVEAYEAYKRYLAAQAYIEAYEAASYTPTNTQGDYTEGTAVEGYAGAYEAYESDKEYYDNAVAEASELDEEENAEALENLKKLIRTDLGIVGASGRAVRTTREAIEQLPTVYEAAPQDLIINVTKSTEEFGDGQSTGYTIVQSDGSVKTGQKYDFKGALKLTYQNNNSNTNYPFHLYIPLYVKYYYQNNAPAYPVVVYACVEVLSSKQNETAGK